VQEAKQHAEEDETFRKLVEARNQGDQLAYQLEQTLGELGDKVSESDAQSIREKIEALREATKGDDADAIRQAIDDANQAFSTVSQQMYEQAAAAEQAQQAEQAEGTTGGPTGAAEAGGEDDEVIDAEFEATDEE